ncbi:hypothetical protein [Zoogloea sp. LCSB751]|uniref:hypothetical protein n=1 Tax=Zoogloea sp. LCSB751 TaxID=1965277 RepID=UPI0009A5415F|nr:hypothetical protein [Zoogloea sp. LCSB751]
MLRIKQNNGIRDDILRLQRTAHTVINGAPLSKPYEEDLWEAQATQVEAFQLMARMCITLLSRISPSRGLNRSWMIDRHGSSPICA